MGTVRSGPDPTSPRRPTSTFWTGPVARAWLAVAAWIALVLWLGSGGFGAGTTSRILIPLLRWLLPGVDGVQIWNLALTIRKLAHPTVYGVLGLLAFRAGRLGWPGAGWRAALLACGLTLLVSSVDESRQAFEPTRTGSPWDVALDTAGAVAAVAAASIALQARALARPREPDGAR